MKERKEEAQKESQKLRWKERSSSEKRREEKRRDVVHTFISPHPSLFLYLPGMYIYGGIFLSRHSSFTFPLNSPRSVNRSLCMYSIGECMYVRMYVRITKFQISRSCVLPHMKMHVRVYRCGYMYVRMRGCYEQERRLEQSHAAGTHRVS